MQASNPEEYWRRTVFIPFLDHLIQDLNDRFSQLNQDAVRGLKLLPHDVSRLSSDDTTVILDWFVSNLPSPGSFEQEIHR